MNRTHRIAIVGSGPTAIYLLKHFADNVSELRTKIGSISVFEKASDLGMGMPYSPETTDKFNMCNISSAELPKLDIAFADGLRSLDDQALNEHGIQREAINDSDTYSRLAMGRYFSAQYRAMVDGLRSSGITVDEFAACRVTDIADDPKNQIVHVITEYGEAYEFDRVVIATGHSWSEKDHPDSGYFTSPWPIQKLLPEAGGFHNLTIGTLGASLSAFDVVSSLAHRHGRFVGPNNRKFQPYANADEFKIVMHAAHGWLPHLQYEQEEAFREIYRHVDRDDLLALRNSEGFLLLDVFFDKVCRPALIEAFKKDQRTDLVVALRESDYSMDDFVEQMTNEHTYEDAFDGMRREMPDAKESITRDRPIHWKEVVDDLMYTLNFHAEMLPAEDHIRFHSDVMSFLMNVIAAMPLKSARMLLALREAGRLELVTGYATEIDKAEGSTQVIVDDNGTQTEHRYKMFVDCSGQGALPLDQFPFLTLRQEGAVREARVQFFDIDAKDALSGEKAKKVCERDGKHFYRIGGIDIDGTYRVIGDDGKCNPRILDIAFPHTTGVRPYSYGLQACNLTAAIVVESWINEAQHVSAPQADIHFVTQMYEEVNEV